MGAGRPGRPKTRSAESKPVQFWLEPHEVDTLQRYALFKGKRTMADGLRVLLEKTRAWVDQEAVRRLKVAKEPALELGESTRERPAEPEAEPEPVEEDTCPEVRQAREVIRGEQPSDLPEGVIYGIPPSVIRADEERRRLWREAQERAEQMTEEEVEGWDEAAQEAWHNDRR